jgi:hypothetical protein
MRKMDGMPEFDIPGAVRERLTRYGVLPPKIIHAALDPEVVMLGAAALLVGEFFRNPPIEV